MLLNYDIKSYDVKYSTFEDKNMIIIVHLGTLQLPNKLKYAEKKYTTVQ